MVRSTQALQDAPASSQWSVAPCSCLEGLHVCRASLDLEVAGRWPDEDVGWCTGWCVVSVSDGALSLTSFASARTLLGRHRFDETAFSKTCHPTGRVGPPADVAAQRLTDMHIPRTHARVHTRTHVQRRSSPCTTHARRGGSASSRQRLSRPLRFSLRFARWSQSSNHASRRSSRLTSCHSARGARARARLWLPAMYSPTTTYPSAVMSPRAPS